ncbi:MAG: DUF1614 domain-containing protein [Nitrospirota bacterium]|jgi:uncharacterized membrane protein|nr:DUF1614 domain-containing protein [Nitrospirota bacterium]MDH4361010.1 DUF1614 domain-containing protein [Nitrospirota bacterium]MDH5574990.1 DUF1614 domain-containing protein [Nitrospirota bacterium]
MNGRLGCLPIFLFLVLLFLLPLVFAQFMGLALVKLRLDPSVAMLVIVGIFLGSVVNIPITRMVRQDEVIAHPYPLFGFLDIWPYLQRSPRETILAVNLGGCVIPTLVAVYEILQILGDSLSYLFPIVLAVAINTGVCYRLAKPVKGIGIAMPALVPPLVAALTALLLAPEEAPSVAFVAGVFGPLLGADVLHLREIPRIATGMASIGGAGTFDGIVLSGILAAYLA